MNKNLKLSVLLISMYLHLAMIIPLAFILPNIEKLLEYKNLIKAYAFLTIAVFIFFIVMAVINISNSVKFYRNGDLTLIRERMKVTRYASTPYFIIRFILVITYIVFLINFAISFFLDNVFIFLSSIFVYHFENISSIPYQNIAPFVSLLSSSNIGIVLLVIDIVICSALTSPDSIAYIVKLRKLKKLSVFLTVLLIIMQCFLLTGIIASIILTLNKQLQLYPEIQDNAYQSPQNAIN